MIRLLKYLYSWVDFLILLKSNLKTYKGIDEGWGQTTNLHKNKTALATKQYNAGLKVNIPHLVLEILMCLWQIRIVCGLKILSDLYALFSCCC